jgi:MFS family permease
LLSPQAARSWRQAASREQWRALGAAQLGWLLDGMDVMLYAFALTTIQREFGLGSAGAGAMASLTLATSAAGGAFGGYFADRYGRARVLAFAILTYSLFTGLTGSAHRVWTLALWRSAVGFGLGAVWSAGSVLVAETWPAEHRAKAVGLMQSGWALGYLAAAMLTGAILPRFGWRPLSAVGAAPALLAIWIWRAVPEPEVWRSCAGRGARRIPAKTLFRAPLVRRFALATALCASMQFAYWGLFTWIPAYLSSPVERGGAGLSVLRSTAWIVPLQIGAFAGYTLFGVLADRFGRRPVFQTFVIAAAVLAPVYGIAARNRFALLLLGPLLGFFGHGFFSVFGALLAELFPSGVRATAQGFAYNFGRATGAAAPAMIGALADAYGVGSALASTSAFFAAGAILIAFLPETRGEQLE